MKFPLLKKKITTLLNLVISITLLLEITLLTHTEFILPPFLATAATKYPDPDWKMNRSYSIIASYILSGTMAVIFVSFGLTNLVMAIIGSFVTFIIEILFNIEHPPSILSTFLGILEKVGPLYLLHPVLSGVVLIEGVNYLISKYLESRF